MCSSSDPRRLDIRFPRYSAEDQPEVGSERSPLSTMPSTRVDIPSFTYGKFYGMTERHKLMTASRRSTLKHIGKAGVAIVGLSGVTKGQIRRRRGEQGISCEKVRIPVGLGPGLPENYEIAGRLCLPNKGLRKEGIVHLLLHGGTYGSVYNDFPYRPEKYSFRRFMNNHGYSTLNIDRIGVDESSQPPPELVTLDTNAFVVHQIAQRLREGNIGGVSFSDVVLIGHSYGSITSVVAQSEYSTADYLILTGYSPQDGRGGLILNGLRANLYPAMLDDDEDINDRPPGYLTTMPGSRPLLYHDENTEQKVISVDEETKETVTDAEMGTLLTEKEDLQDINTPVLEVIGEHDVFFCGPNRCGGPLSIKRTDSEFFPNAESFEVKIIPDAGHNLYLHLNADRTFTTIKDWSNEHII